MRQKKTYLKPQTGTTPFSVPVNPLCQSPTTPVDPSQEGDQSTAEGRSYRHSNVWDDDNDDHW